MVVVGAKARRWRTTKYKKKKGERPNADKVFAQTDQNKRAERVRRATALPARNWCALAPAPSKPRAGRLQSFQAPTHFLSYSQGFLGSAGTRRQGEVRREKRKERKKRKHLKC